MLNKGARNIDMRFGKTTLLDRAARRENIRNVFSFTLPYVSLHPLLPDKLSELEDALQGTTHPEESTIVTWRGTSERLAPYYASPRNRDVVWKLSSLGWRNTKVGRPCSTSHLAVFFGA